MKLIIFSEHPDLHSTKRLLEEAIKQNLDGSINNPYQMDIMAPCFEPYNDTIILHRTTGIRFNDYDLNLSLTFEAQGASIFNPVDSFLRLRDKQKQAVFYNGNKISTIPSYSIRKKPIHEDIDKIADFFTKCNPAIKNSESFILKTLRGNQGVGVNLINGKKSLFSLLETLWAIQDQDFLIQPYLSNGIEYRIFLAKNKIIGAVKKWPDDNDFRSNSGRGKAISITEQQLPEKIAKFADQAFRLSGALYAGIDLMVWNDSIYLIEINLVPGFKLLENLSGFNVAKEIISNIKESI